MNKDTIIMKAASIIIGITSLIIFMGAMGACENGDMRLITFLLITIAMWALIISSTLVYFYMRAIEDRREMNGSRKNIRE